MSDRKLSPFPILLNNDVCSLIQAAEDVYQIRFKNRAANAYLVRGRSRTIMIDVGLSSNYPALLECLHHLDCPPEKIDMVVLSHEHLDHIGAAYHFHGRTIIAAHRLAANKIMLRDDFSMLRKMFNEPEVPINIDIWLEEGNLLDLGNFRLDVMYTPGHTSACISLFDQDKGLLFSADTLDARRRDGRGVRIGQHRRLYPVAGTAEGPELEDPAVGAWPAVRHAAGRRPDRAAAFARAIVRHGAIVRRAGCAVEFRADHAVGARSQQARRRLIF
jgi:glyoxylase-like metal-dependent hydrolase (beta-lactamase superfamily II)